MVKWYHNIDVGDLYIKGETSQEHQKFIVSNLPKDFSGKTVLDLAAWDGYYSYVASLRGAKIVVAVDDASAEERHFKTENRQTAIEYLYKKIDLLNNSCGGKIHFTPIDVGDINKLKMTFDIVFCFGIYYHLEDVYSFFKKCYDICNETMYVEGHFSVETEYPTFQIYDIGELNNDPTNVWSPTKKGLIKLLKRIGFKDIIVLGTFSNRIMLKCSK